MEKVSDFRFSDFYMSVADDRKVRTLDSDVVIVALDGCDREGIGRAITDADYCGARAIGLDVVFGTPREGLDDSYLRNALMSVKQLVLPVVVDDETLEVRHVSYYDSVLHDNVSPRYAAINIEGTRGMRRIVREFRGHFGPVPSMAAALAGDSRSDEQHTIAFASRTFNILAPDEIIGNEALIDGKIVIMGKLNDAADQHATPLNNFMPGVLIHAYSISTLLNDASPRSLPQFVQWIVAFVCCYLVVWLNLYLNGRNIGNLIVRVVQVILLYLMILSGTWFYTRQNIDLDFGFPMLMVSLGLLAHDIVCGVLGPKIDFKRLKNKTIQCLKNDKIEKPSVNTAQSIDDGER